MFERATLIANPASGYGAGRHIVTQAVAAFRRADVRVHVLQTERPRHAIELAAHATAAGARFVVALGGDGTLQEVVAGVLANGSPPEDLVIGAIPCGSGNSFLRDFGLSRDTPEQSIDRFLASSPRPIDAIRLRWMEGRAERVTHGLNLFSTGFVAKVAQMSNKYFKVLGGLGYSAGVLCRLPSMTPSMVKLEMCDEKGRTVLLEEPLSVLVVCNSQWTGGGDMWIAPNADPSDGLLDVVFMRALSRLELLRAFPTVFSGAHLSHPAVRTYTVRSISVAPSTAEPLLLDGEVFGSTPAIVEVVPSALRMAL